MTPRRKRKITVLIPCYNEEEGIASVIDGFPRAQIERQGYTLDVVVIDNNSQDRTGEIARAHGATVLFEPKKGKGNAIRRGFYSIGEDTDYVVMLDGDNTYHPEEVLRLVELLDSGFCNVAIGSRLGGRVVEGSMHATNRIGNWVFSHLVRYFYRVNVTDVLTGYFAWKREAIERLRPHLRSEGFAIEMEMVTKMAKLGEDIYCVPITYAARAGDSHLRPFYDGSRILWMFTKNLFWKPQPSRTQQVAFVSDSVLPYFKGGKETRLNEISRRLVKEGREVHIYTMQWWKGPNTVVHDGVIFHALCRYYPLYRGDRRSILQAIIFGVSALKLLLVKFDILDVDHMPLFPLISARVVTWLRGKKLYATWHEVWGREYWLNYMGGPSGLLGYAMERLTFLLPDVIIANSEHTANRLRAAGARSVIKTVSLGADLESIYSAEKGKIESDIIYVGRLLSHKNVDMLVGALQSVKARIPDIKLLIVGDGPEKSKVENRINVLGLQDNVTILSGIDQDTEKYGLMKGSKMLVLPSIREGFGLVVVEAHMAGLPVITTSHKDNAAKDLIREGVNGFLCAPNETDIAENILHVLRVRGTLNPKIFVNQHDWSVVAKNIESAFG
jgi:glycosyltransferase involved in cell wall biosynthesis